MGDATPPSLSATPSVASSRRKSPSVSPSIRTNRLSLKPATTPPGSLPSASVAGSTRSRKPSTMPQSKSHPTTLSASTSAAPPGRVAELFRRTSLQASATTTPGISTPKSVGNKRQSLHFPLQRTPLLPQSTPPPQSVASSKLAPSKSVPLPKPNGTASPPSRPKLPPIPAAKVSAAAIAAMQDSPSIKVQQPTSPGTATNGFGEMSWRGGGGPSSGDLVTDIEDEELDEEMQAALRSVAQAHTSALGSLKRVLSAADSGSAMSLHLLHTEISLLQDRSKQDTAEIEKLKRANAALKLQTAGGANGIRTFGSKRIVQNSVGSMIDILSTSNDAEIRAYFRTLPGKSRMHLLHLLLEAALPGDIATLKRYLSQVEKDKYDIIAELPSALAAKCLLHLDVHAIMNCRLVSKRWDKHITSASSQIWRTLALRLTSTDDEPPCPTPPENSWFRLYQSLHFREQNWRQGLAQKVLTLPGHTASVSAMRLRGTMLVTGSLDGTLRMWDLKTRECLRVVKMPAPVSCLDFHGKSGVVAAGGNDVGRVFLISKQGAMLNTLSGHNKGIRTVAMNENYLISAGYDKALVVWDWKKGTRVVKFGQQTSPCAAISLFGSMFSSIQVDGVIRCFNIATRELMSQHKIHGDAGLSKSIGGDVFQWFVAEERRVILATKATVFQLEYTYNSAEGMVDLRAPPEIVSATPLTHELHTGTLDVLKRRFAAAPRFANRLGSEMRIFVGHLPTSAEDEDANGDLKPIEGAWLDSADSVSVASRNPTCMALSSDKLCVGCSDGLLYALDFCGMDYRPSRSLAESPASA